MDIKRYSLEIIVFIGGAVVMILEIVGARVLAPYVGTSIIAWTSIIGSILASLSLGYWWGGSLADAQPTYRRFSFILLISAIFILIVAWAKDFILAGMIAIPDLRDRSLIASLVLFAPASTALGMIAPFAARLRMHEVETSGRTVGRLYAISTIGSIVGTFATGFFLLSYLGTSNILFLLVALQLGNSILASLSIRKQAIVGLALIAASVFPYTLFPFQALAFRDIDTDYHRVWVYDVQDGVRTVRYLDTEYLAHQSGMYLDNPNELVFDYTKMYRLRNHFHPGINRALLVGGGGYSAAKDFLITNPRAILDVVEIDPGLTEIARKYFNLPESDRLNIHHQDARLFINESSASYDVIIGDAFRSSYSIPYHLTTLEAVKEYRRIMSANGVMLLNIIASLEGPGSVFLNAEYATFKKVFPQVYIFPVNPNAAGVQNILLVALASEETPSFQSVNPEYTMYLRNRLTRPVAEGMILTDDYAPVDQFLAKTLQQ